MKLALGLCFLVVAAGASAGQFDECYLSELPKIDTSQISEKIVLNGAKNQPFAILSNSSYPTFEEKAQIASWASIREYCHNQTDLHTNPTHNKAAVNIIQSHYTITMNAIAKLHAGKITYGEFAQQRLDAINNYERSFDALEAQEQAEMRAQDNYAAQQAAMQEQMRLQAMQHGLDSFNRSMDRNFPRQTNCTSTNSFGVVSTSCR